MGGNLTKDLSNHYCLRGLEPYQSSSLNAEMHSHRCMYHQTVLKEQRLQKRAGIVDPDRIHEQVSHMSSWALRRAQRLALLDARDVMLGTDTSSNISALRRNSMLSPRSSSLQQHQQSSRTSASHSHSASQPPQQQQGVVDVDQLKAWNVKLLQHVMGDQHQQDNMQKQRRRHSSVTASNYRVSENTLLHDESPEMSLHALLVAPCREQIAQRAPDFLTTAVPSGGDSSNQQQTVHLPYRVIRRDSLCGFSK
jgi:hypothetical protein